MVIKGDTRSVDSGAYYLVKYKTIYHDIDFGSEV